MTKHTEPILVHDFATLRRELARTILSTDQTQQTILAHVMRLLDPVFRMHRRNARALRAVLGVASTLEAAAMPLQGDDATQEAINHVRAVAAQQIKEAVAIALDLTTEQLREFQYSI